MDELFKLGKMIAKGGGSGSHGGSHGYNGPPPPQGAGYNDPYYGAGGGGYGAPGGYNQYGGGVPPQMGFNQGPPMGGAYGGYNQPPPMGGYGPGYNQPGGYGQPGGYYGGGAPGMHPGGAYGGAHGGGNLHGPMAVLKSFDKDGDGMITENDFIIALRQMGLGHFGDSAARSVFRSLDKNRNGRLDMNEAVGAIGILKGGGKSHGLGY